MRDDLQPHDIAGWLVQAGGGGSIGRSGTWTRPTSGNSARPVLIQAARTTRALVDAVRQCLSDVFLAERQATTA